MDRRPLPVQFARAGRDGPRLHHKRFEGQFVGPGSYEVTRAHKALTHSGLK